MKNSIELFQYTKSLLEDMSIRHEIHSFPSRAVMVDVWDKGKFYVFQFETGFIGFSEIDDQNPGFDMVPDEKFYDNSLYVVKLRELFGIQNIGER